MATKRRHPITVGFVALGCPKNTVDSEAMLAGLVQAGFTLVSDPDRAEIVIVNTCGFIQPAQEESLEAIRHAMARKGTGKVVVTGCLAERLGTRLFDLVPGIDAVVGLAHRDLLPEILGQLRSDPSPGVFLSRSNRFVSEDRVRLRIGPAHWAYLRISEGCNHRCSFCTIPAIRGPFRSKPLDQVMAEARQLVDSGVVELNLVAQDTTQYEKDLAAKGGLVKLLKDLETLDGLAWIRLLYLYPTGITNALIETLASSRKILHYLDLPLQHVDATILKAMGRPHSRSGLEHLVLRIRKALPDIVLRTTLIVGFPGETEAHVDGLIDFIRWARFDALGCFPYYAEPGTRAAALPGQVPAQVSQERHHRVMLAQQEVAFELNRARAGQMLTCLVDEVDSKTRARGRFYGQAPEIDGICLIRGPVRAGQFVRTQVTGSAGYDLTVKCLSRTQLRD